MALGLPLLEQAVHEIAFRTRVLVAAKDKAAEKADTEKKPGGRPAGSRNMTKA